MIEVNLDCVSRLDLDKKRLQSTCTGDGSVLDSGREIQSTGYPIQCELCCARKKTVKSLQIVDGPSSSPDESHILYKFFVSLLLSPSSPWTHYFTSVFFPGTITRVFIYVPCLLPTKGLLDPSTTNKPTQLWLLIRYASVITS